jgi:hypothetical protein
VHGPGASRLTAGTGRRTPERGSGRTRGRGRRRADLAPRSRSVFRLRASSPGRLPTVPGAFPGGGSGVWPGDLGESGPRGDVAGGPSARPSRRRVRGGFSPPSLAPLPGAVRDRWDERGRRLPRSRTGRSGLPGRRQPPKVRGLGGGLPGNRKAFRSGSGGRRPSGLRFTSSLTLHGPPATFADSVHTGSVRLATRPATSLLRPTRTCRSPFRC